MKILTVDIGTGTQDIYLFDTRLNIENGYKLILPSPTMMVRQRIREAVIEKRDVLLTGVIMGGGPSGWAVGDLIRSGLKVYATLDAAKTFDDDPAKIKAMGIEVISEDEADRLDVDIKRIQMRDFDFELIHKTFKLYGVSLDNLDAIAVAVFDHGDAPPDISDRQFRFDYLDQRLRAENRLSAFAYKAEDIPGIMTRMKAVAASGFNLPAPLVVMDTAPAAVLGAVFDPLVTCRPRNLILNIGNLHTLAFRLGPGGIEGVFEHHTPVLKPAELEGLIKQFAAGTLTHKQVFDHHGHGALLYTTQPYPMDADDFNVVVTGPRRNQILGSDLKPYFAVPFGDMMLTGCFGLLAAVADLIPELGDGILRSLTSNGITAQEPWKLE